jgi:hypothetical protein
VPTSSLSNLLVVCAAVVTTGAACGLRTTLEPTGTSPATADAAAPNVVRDAGLPDTAPVIPPVNSTPDAANTTTTPPVTPDAASPPPPVKLDAQAPVTPDAIGPARRDAIVATPDVGTVQPGRDAGVFTGPDAGGRVTTTRDAGVVVTPDAATVPPRDAGFATPDARVRPGRDGGFGTSDVIISIPVGPDGGFNFGGFGDAGFGGFTRPEAGSTFGGGVAGGGAGAGRGG